MDKCYLCKGLLQNGLVSYVADINGLIIIIKKVPADVCKQCGDFYLNHKIALQVEDIIENLKNNNAEVIIVNFDDRAA